MAGRTEVPFGNHTVIISGDSLSRELYLMIGLMYSSPAEVERSERRILLNWDGEKLSEAAQLSSSVPDACQEKALLDVDELLVASCNRTVRVLALVRSPHQAMRCQIKELQGLLNFVNGPASVITNLRIPHHLQWSTVQAFQTDLQEWTSFFATQASAIRKFYFQPPPGIHAQRYSFITPQRAQRFQREVEDMLTTRAANISWTVLPQWTWTSSRLESSWDGLHYILGNNRTTMHFGIAIEAAIAFVTLLSGS